MSRGCGSEGSGSRDGDSGSTVLEFVLPRDQFVRLLLPQLSVEVECEEVSISISASGATEGDDCGRLNSFK